MDDVRQAFFESDEEYAQRLDRLAKERTIERAAGRKPYQRFFESDEDYAQRLTREAHESQIRLMSGDAPSQGLFESLKGYEQRIAVEARQSDLNGAINAWKAQYSDPEKRRKLIENANPFFLALLKNADDVDERIRKISCFISYSSKDESFARKLVGDLEAADVTCWFAPHNMAIGAKIRPGIDEAITKQDKILLVLSKNSISSYWVEKEVETAFEREISTGTTLLVPIMLDSTVMVTQAAWAADIRRQRNIGDFSDWLQPECYRIALARLLQSLR